MKYFVTKALWIIMGLVLVVTIALPRVFADENPPGAEDDLQPQGVMLAVTGIVNNRYQLEGDDGLVYEIGVGELGDDLIRHMGERVSVIGDVTEEENEKTISVINYQLLGEK